MGLSLLFLCYGLWVISQYGVTWDEPLHRNWGKLFVYYWKTGNRQALELMPGNGVNYGPLFFTLNYLLSEWVYSHEWMRFVAANHLLTLITASCAVGLVFVLGRMIGGTRTGLIAAVALALFPQFLAHAQYNPKDIPLMTTVVLTSTVFYAGLRKGCSSLLLLSAFLMGMSIAAKVNALLMAPVYGCVYLLWLTADQASRPLRSVAQQLRLLLGAVFLLCVGTLLFWPSAWGDPLLIVRAVSFFVGHVFWSGKVLYFGTEYGGAALPWHYIPFEFFGAAPAVFLGGFIIGACVAVRSIFGKVLPIGHIFLILWITFPIAYSVLPGVVRYDGIRQFFFVLPAACVLVAVGIGWVFDALQRRFQFAWLIPIISLCLVVDLVHEIAILHPLEGSYRNEVIRVIYPSHMDRVLQIEYWGATYKQGMEWLIEHADPNPIICVPTAGVLVDWYPWRSDFTFDCSKDSQYVMFFTRYSEAGEFAELEMNPVFAIDRMGARLLSIYKVK